MKVKLRKIRNQVKEVQLLFADAKRLNEKTPNEKFKKVITDVQNFLSSYKYYEENKMVYIKTRQLLEMLENYYDCPHSILKLREFVDRTLNELRKLL